MKKRAHKIFWGILLLMAAAVLILYGVGFGGEAYGIPFYKILLGIILVSLILSKLVFSHNMRDRLKIFVYSSLLFMVFEKEIAALSGLSDENIINNWILLFAAILAEAAVGLLIPKRSPKNHYNSFSASTQYLDVSEKRKTHIENRIGATEVYFQNTEFVDDDAVIELTVINKMGAIEIHAPQSWRVENHLINKLGAVEIRPNTESKVTLILNGENSMGAIEVTSP